MIRKFGGSSGVEFQPQGVDIGVGGGSLIKSIQRGNSAMSYTSTSMEISISSIDKSKSIIRISQGGASGSSGGALSTTLLKATFKNGESKIVIERASTMSATQFTVQFSWEVIEFAPSCTIQSGVATMSQNATTASVSISNIDMSKSLLFFSHNTPVGTNGAYAYFDPWYALLYGLLLSSTSIYFGRDGADGICSANISWFVVELK
ncbi:hypothetical protein GH811_17620 [Acetobacterium malicum]|uniref:H-type lectin domain-containing protein n=1 Tax=Acetobacterium malicum TaxID=52692 RepID=A0ABR6Z1R0_9FIRM|nr:hypothetical protein [Acetobacterium malicum]MBC3901422.1 hypothetical protein [Acetobacterium malicum]